jgi:Spy/CpxP family protein refolding chaperone
MKKLLTLSVAACILGFAASAQTERTTTEAPQTHQHHKGRHDKDEMMKQLNLSKEQKGQLKAQHKDMKAKKDALKAQDNITVKEWREKKEALKAEQQSKTNAILTEEQRTKMAELRKQKKAQRANKSADKNSP